MIRYLFQSFSYSFLSFSLYRSLDCFIFPHSHFISSVLQFFSLYFHSFFYLQYFIVPIFTSFFSLFRSLELFNFSLTVYFNSFFYLQYHCFSPLISSVYFFCLLARAIWPSTHMAPHLHICSIFETIHLVCLCWFT